MYVFLMSILGYSVFVDVFYFLYHLSHLYHPRLFCVLCLGFALCLGLCSRVEVQIFCGKLSWIGFRV